MSDSLAQAWPTAVAFVYPVGDPHDFARAESAHAGYTLLRGVSAAHDSTPPHQGVDLGNGSRGGIVRAAASGIVVRGRGDDWQDGYGYYVTLAHRLPDGSLIYTVYAHLAKGSVRPAAGRVVKAGQPLGRVGRTGRATTAHLHFEVRRCTDPGERWEKAPVEDPLVFLHEHIATREATTAGP